jgi:hypothetical protein
MDPTRREFLATAATTVGAAASGLAQAEHQHEHSQPAVPSEVGAINTRLTRSFGIKHPIICAPMAFIGGGALAAAVSRAGGLEFVGGGSML